MAIDKNRLNQLHRESRALLESVADRLPSDRLREYRSFSDVGEWLLLVDSMCASLVKRQIPVTSGERDALRAVLTLFPPPGGDHLYLNDVSGTLAALNVVAGRSD